MPNCLPPNLNKTPRDFAGIVMGFDFGLKRIGVAIGQTQTATANPHTTLTSRDGVPDWQSISALVEQWQPLAFIVGLPLRLDGSEQPFTQSARKFGQRLHGRFQRPVFFVEEQLSSFDAEQRNAQQKTKVGQKPQPLDAIAAQIILENGLQL